MEFKKLEIEPEGNLLKRLITSAHFKKSIIYIAAGAAIGFLITFFGKGAEFSQLSKDELLPNILTGAFIGFFLTNSPCARNKC